MLVTAQAPTYWKHCRTLNPLRSGTARCRSACQKSDSWPDSVEPGARTEIPRQGSRWHSLAADLDQGVGMQLV